MGYPYHGTEVCGDCWRVYPEGISLLRRGGPARGTFRVRTLEVPGYRRYWPRYSFFDLPWPARLVMRVLAPIGFPIVCAEDTITIGQKPLDGPPCENTTK